MGTQHRAVNADLLPALLELPAELSREGGRYLSKTNTYALTNRSICYTSAGCSKNVREEGLFKRVVREVLSEEAPLQRKIG